MHLCICRFITLCCALCYDVYMQLLTEVKGALDFLEFAYGVFGFTFELELSTVQELYCVLWIARLYIILCLSS